MKRSELMMFKMPFKWSLLIIISGLLVVMAQDKGALDVQEGQTVKLECRFSTALQSKSSSSTLYWIRTNRNGHDNVAIGGTPFDENYSLDHRPAEGIYDLTLASATYNRDNGVFECRMKEGGSGHELHSMTVQLTVLSKPQKPKINPEGRSLTATEGRPLNLTCESLGGSPPPTIQWMKIGGDVIESSYTVGKNRDEPTSAVLTIHPSKENDNTAYKCQVWNRAMTENEKMEEQTTISVNYFPRLTLGPDNPLRVEVGSAATLSCQVDSKPAVTSVKWSRNDRFLEDDTIRRVTLQDAGSYICSADNGLGQISKAELTLDVLHAPIVTLPKGREVREGEEVVIDCEVSSNPRPAEIRWTKEGDSEFAQVGPKLKLNAVSAMSDGRYVCSATNEIHPSGKVKEVRSGNASIDINVRHKPGQAIVTPDNPVAVEGKSLTLKCSAKPEGFPRPKYNWWKEGGEVTVVAQPDYLIESASLKSAGKYFCQPINELGEGGVASATVEVHQSPKVITELQSSITKRAGDTGFHVTCSAVARPKPRVKWLKDGLEIPADSNMFQIANTDEDESILTTLKYFGPDRIGSDQLMPTDRGHYTCQFENEVGMTESGMLLKIEHSPVVVHHHNKVAFDLGESAVITCRMQAFPSPRLDWSIGNDVIQGDQQQQNLAAATLTDLGDDIFEGVLRIGKVVDASYGDYICKGANSMGAKRTIIKLQPKGKPGKPSNVRPVSSTYDAVTLEWDEGFDGGYNNTMYTVQYTKQGDSSSTPRYQDCRHHNPCNLTGLEQHSQYQVKVKASNIRGESQFSREVSVLTKVDAAMIPKPESVHYARQSKSATFEVSGANSLPLVAKVELENGDGTWSHFGDVVMAEKAVGELSISSSQQQQQIVNNLRVRFCLETNDALCGPYVDAQMVEVSPVLSGGETTPPWLIAVIVVAAVIAVAAVIITVKCCCCRTPKKKTVSRPDIVHQQFPVENKSTIAKGEVYDFTGSQAYPEQQSNSANSGSVNSQDSLWNIKSGGGAVPVFEHRHSQYPQHHQQQSDYEQQQQQYMEQQPQEEYAHYPYPDEYLNERNQQYLIGEAYGIGRQQQQHLEGEYSPYGNVSGLPDPYTHRASIAPHYYPPPQHPEANFEDETDFAPTNQRGGRRVIREIIV